MRKTLLGLALALMPVTAQAAVLSSQTVGCQFLSDFQGFERIATQDPQMAAKWLDDMSYRQSCFRLRGGTSVVVQNETRDRRYQCLWKQDADFCIWTRRID